MSKKEQQLLHTKAFVEKQDKEEGVLEASVASSGVIDRMGESINQDGWELKNFKRNPVLLWAHNAGLTEARPPIGKVTKLWMEGVNKKRLMFSVKFDMEDEFAKGIARKFKDGFLNAFSVGFQALERVDNEYTKAELLEISAVPVPANPEALSILRSADFEAKEWDELYDTKGLTTQNAVKQEETKEEEKPVEETPKEEDKPVEENVDKPVEVVDNPEEKKEEEPVEETPKEEEKTISEDDIRRIVKDVVRTELKRERKSKKIKLDNNILPEMQDTLRILATITSIALKKINDNQKKS